LRGKSDLAAIYRLYHDPEVHSKLSPHGAKQRELFEKCEQARIEVIAAQYMVGIAKNVQALLTQELLNLDGKDLAEQLRFTIYHHCTGQNLTLSSPSVTDGSTEKLALSHRGHQADLIINGSAKASLGPSAALRDENLIFVTQLNQHIYHQTKYAEIVLQMISKIVKEEELPPEELPVLEQQINSFNDISSRPQKLTATRAQSVGKESKELIGAPHINFKVAQVVQEVELPYHPYTTLYDQVIAARDLVTSEELQNLRDKFKKQLLNFRTITNVQAQRFRRKLLAKRRNLWEYDIEEGYLDSRKLPHLIINPHYPYYRKNTKHHDDFDSLVTLLIDNSGSMRGKQINIAAISAEILAHTLESCGIKVEILGFTTRNWRGGESYKLWQNESKTLNPGRMNDLLHIVYKSINEPWSKARNNLGVMLKDTLLKENIDGEALLWAYKRAMASGAKRKIMLVISDGAPVDDATLSCNNSNYLDRHLRQVIRQIEKNKLVELVAIGIGHDLSHYYRNSVTINDSELLGEIIFTELSRIFDSINIYG
jgi:cobaltochelatase CobT